ncbi:hypothetical protein [Sphingomonas sp. HMP6]|uniref:hypothetical protein n=1 Tax=Sphingomonas sp. HMP6 TaxID=1517551 RepID=UPI001596FF76|nr:hypothetical protein [Sphingomonas sp. HMP6]BCA60250.1 hypothetical protein HMP06_3019 [Sphingomonas sp. HMP6]
MIDQPTLAGILAALFTGLVIVSICVGILLTMTGAVLLAFVPAPIAHARKHITLAVARIAFGLAGFFWGAWTLVRVLL